MLRFKNICLVLCWGLVNLQCTRTPASILDDTDKFFANDRVVHLQIKIDEKSIQEIDREDRPFVKAELVEDNKVVYRDVSIKLKGAAGSFRNFGDRPALTIKTNRVTKDQQFHGMVKFHLNNSVQDESYLNEFICADIFASAKYPATRVSYARVWLNDRDVGLYVLKEGFDKRFLSRHFTRPWGNLYDGGFLQDIDAELEKDDGDGPDDHSDLHRLAEAAKLEQPQARWRSIAAIVDIDRFLTFMALERMTSHWDGYCLQSNNYRLYFDSRNDRAVFLPHGMDQMFGDPHMSLWNHPGPLISRAIMQNNAWRARYRKRVEQLLPKLKPDVLGSKIDALQVRLQPVLQSISPELAENQANQAKDFKRRITERYNSIQNQLREPDPEILEFGSEGELNLTDWWPVLEAGKAELTIVDKFGKEKKPAYKIALTAEPPVVASWRKGFLLGPGKYRFSVRSYLENYQPAENEPAGVRLLNNFIAVESTQNNYDRWTTQTLDFEVLEDRREVELILELRGAAGDAYFDCESIKLKKLD